MITDKLLKQLAEMPEPKLTADQQALRDFLRAQGMSAIEFLEIHNREELDKILSRK